jgi:hypothetical protein
MKLKGLHFADVAEIQEAVTDELKKVQKEKFSAGFQELYDHAKACIQGGTRYVIPLIIHITHFYYYIHFVREKVKI